MTVPTYLFYFIAAGTVAVLIAIFYGLNRALVDAHWSAADRTRTLRVSAVILLGWLAAAITLSAMGIFHVTSGDRPTIQYGILLPILIGALMIWRWEAAKRVLHAVPQQWLVGVQLYRALGAIFLILYAAGKLPGLRLACRCRGHRRRPLGTFCGSCLRASAAQGRGSCCGVERAWSSRSH